MAKDYHEDYFYSGDNAISIEEHMTDTAEVDADAFSLAYCLFVLDYENEDLTFDIKLMYGSDGGLRKERAGKIADEYGFI